MKKLEIGRTYESRCYGDYELTSQWTITKRTAKTITAVDDLGEVKTVKIRVMDDRECAKMEDGFAFIKA